MDFSSIEYKHPWQHLLHRYHPIPIFPISPLTEQSIHLLHEENRTNLYTQPVNLTTYITRLTSDLLNTNITYSDHICKILQPSSPLWIAMLISNTLKETQLTSYYNTHIHPIENKIKLDYIHILLLLQILSYNQSILR